MHFDEHYFTYQCEKEKKMAYGFQILSFYWLCSSDIMAVKGLIKDMVVVYISDACFPLEMKWKSELWCFCLSVPFCLLFKFKCLERLRKRKNRKDWFLMKFWNWNCISVHLVHERIMLMNGSCYQPCILRDYFPCLKSFGMMVIMILFWNEIAATGRKITDRLLWKLKHYKAL